MALTATFRGELARRRIDWVICPFATRAQRTRLGTMAEEAHSLTEGVPDGAPVTGPDLDEGWVIPADPEPPEEIRTLMLRDFGEGYVPV